MNPFWSPFQPKKKPDETGPRYGEVLDRAVASAIDLGLLYLVFNNLFRWVSAILYANIDGALLTQAESHMEASQKIALFIQSGAAGMWLLNSLLQLTILGVFIVTMQCAWGTTPGKWLMGLRIVRRGNFETPSHWRYIVRFLAYIPAALPLMIGILWASFNKERRGWHDMIAGTVVLNIRPRGWYWQQCKRGLRWVRDKIIPAKPPIGD